MAATQVQGKGAGKAVVGDQTQTLSFDSPPTEGNLLVCFGHIDDAYVATIAGWTKVFQDGSGLGGGGGLAAWYKIAVGGESSDVVLDYGEVNRRGGMIIYEYSNPVVLSLDQYVVTYSGAINPKSTGTTPTLTTDAVLAICALALADDNASLGGTSWSNSFVGDLAAEALLVDMFTAVLDVSGESTLESEATYDGSNETGTHGMLVFKDTAPANGLPSYRAVSTSDVESAAVTAADSTARDVGS